MMLLRSLSSELLKLTTIRSTWILAIILFAYVGLAGAGFAGIIGVVGDATADAFEQSGQLPPLIYSMTTSIGYVFPVLLGALSMTGELRFQTITPTLLATPRRGVVLLAKLIAAAIAGAVFGVVGLLGSMGLGALVLGLTGADTGLGDSDIWALAARVVLAMALWSLIGVGLGTLVPNQVAVIVIVLAFTQFVEPILRTASSLVDWAAEIGRFLPGAATDALVGSSFFTFIGGAGADQLEQWQGGGVLLAFAVVLVALGGLTTWRKDVT